MAGGTTGESPTPSRPLTELEGLYLPLSVPQGELSTDVTIPVVADGVSEPEESLRIQLFLWTAEGGQVEGPVLDGTVTDAP